MKVIHTHKSLLLLLSFFALAAWSPSCAMPLIIHGFDIDTFEGRDESEASTFSYTTTSTKQWNFLVHIAANNNLAKNARDNLHQMSLVGSSAHVNILVQLELPNSTEMLRLYVSKDKIYLLQRIPTTPTHNTGTKETIADFFQWATNRYPAQHQALVVWNHGSGALDKVQHASIATGKESQRKCPLVIEQTNTTTQAPALAHDCTETEHKGIAFNDAYGTYVNNHEFQEALESIVATSLGGKKIDLLGLDACYMSMIEVASHAKNSVKFMVGSSNVEPAAGWDYEKVLAPLVTHTMDPQSFSKHIVRCYKETYLKTFPKFTHTALDLDYVKPLEENISALAGQMNSILKSPFAEDFYSLLLLIRYNKMYTTSFNNLDYIDLWHFYESLKAKIEATNNKAFRTFAQDLDGIITEGLSILKTMVVKNVAGSYLSNSHGVSIYFPLKKLHASYPQSLFAQHNEWYPFITEFLSKVSSSLIFIM